VSDVEEGTETSVELGRRAAQRAESRMLIDGEHTRIRQGRDVERLVRYSA